MRRAALALLLLAVAAGDPRHAAAQGIGDLSVAPTRVVLEGRDRNAAITVSNRGSESATFRISVVNMRMTETGEFQEVTAPDPGQMFAEDLIRYSPRVVDLPPGGAQVIRILLNKPDGLAEGEYRSHLFIRGEPKSGGRSIEQQDQSNLSIQLQPIFGVTIPVIVRQGALQAGATFSDFQLLPPAGEDPTPRLRFAINRTGNESTFGDIRTVFQPTGGGQDLVVGELNGLAVYTPNARRIVEVHLRVPNGVDIHKGKLAILYNLPEKEGGRPIARGETTLP